MAYIQRAEDLDVFKKAYSISIDIHRSSQSFPKSEQFELARQIRNCSKSVCANIGEGFITQRIYPEEFKRYITISIRSAGETKIWLKYCMDLGYIDRPKYKNLDDEYDQVIKMLAALREKVSN